MVRSADMCQPVRTNEVLKAGDPSGSRTRITTVKGLLTRLKLAQNLTLSYLGILRISAPFRIFYQHLSLPVGTIILLTSCVPDRFIVNDVIHGNPTERGYQADKWKTCAEQNEKDCAND